MHGVELLFFLRALCTLRVYNFVKVAHIVLMSTLQLIVLSGLIILVLLAFVHLIVRGGSQGSRTTGDADLPDPPTAPDETETEFDEWVDGHDSIEEPEEDDHLPDTEEERTEEKRTEEGGDENLNMAQLKSKARLYHYTAHVTAVYDGDTVTVDVDLGLGLWRQGQTIRLWKVDTPELRGPEREEGLRVRDFVRDLILDRDILLRTILDKRGQDRTGKFGRLLGEILVENGLEEDGDGALINLNDLLLEQGMAIPYGEDGSTLPVGAPAPAASPMPSAKAPDCLPCRYCGEVRDLLDDGTCVEVCPNCLDGRYRL